MLFASNYVFSADLMPVSPKTSTAANFRDNRPARIGLQGFAASGISPALADRL
jgi:hypothetical protein